MLCPYCQHHFTPTDKDIEEFINSTKIKDDTGLYKRITLSHIVCPNEECKKTIITLNILYCDENIHGQLYPISGKKFLDKQIIPEGTCRIFPSYIPQQLREDYEEACKIAELSPKAAATLARRCLQGIIRDFHQINKKNLYEEISQLQGAIDTTLWDAINAVREIGNIGAHMEKDVNLIIDITPEEAKQLIKLIELLFEEWYVRREERKKQLQAIQNISQQKQSLKQQTKI